MSGRRSDVFQGDRHLPVRGMGLSVRFHHNDKGNHEFAEVEIAEDPTQMGLHKGGSGIHIHHGGRLNVGEAEKLLKKRGALSEKGRVYEVLQASSTHNQRETIDGHFIRFREDDIGQDMMRPPRLLGRTISIWGVKIEL